MVFYKYHRQTIAERPEYSKSSDLLILHRHSRGYKWPFQKSRFLKKEAHIFVNISEKGFYVDIENIIQAKWIRELNYILHAGIMEVLEWFGYVVKWTMVCLCIFARKGEEWDRCDGIFAHCATRVFYYH